MPRAIEHFPGATWPAGDAADSLTLDFDMRHRRRLTLTTARGETILLDLPKAVAMADGDGLRLDDARWLRVTAAHEPLAEIRCAGAHDLARIAWHLGNRHLPAEIGEGVIRIRPDHVIEAMLEGLGAAVSHVDAPFQPEGGAYGGGPAQSHAHHDGHERHHEHGHSHPHDHDHGH
jgi:urease accessory protein